jgi:hypothetical protein
MKELYTEGLASHGGPESCACFRKGKGEALTGARTGRVLSCEIRRNQGADTVAMRGRPHGDVTLWRVHHRPCAVGDPLACAETPCARTGRSRALPGRMLLGDALGRTIRQ